MVWAAGRGWSAPGHHDAARHPALRARPGAVGPHRTRRARRPRRARRAVVVARRRAPAPGAPRPGLRARGRGVAPPARCARRPQCRQRPRSPGLAQPHARARCGTPASCSSVQPPRGSSESSWCTRCVDRNHTVRVRPGIPQGEDAGGMSSSGDTVPVPTTATAATPAATPPAAGTPPRAPPAPAPRPPPGPHRDHLRDDLRDQGRRHPPDHLGGFRRRRAPRRAGAVPRTMALDPLGDHDRARLRARAGDRHVLLGARHDHRHRVLRRRGRPARERPAGADGRRGAADGPGDDRADPARHRRVAQRCPRGPGHPAGAGQLAQPAAVTGPGPHRGSRPARRRPHRDE